MKTKQLKDTNFVCLYRTKNQMPFDILNFATFKLHERYLYKSYSSISTLDIRQMRALNEALEHLMIKGGSEDEDCGLEMTYLPF